jgi:quercetin dioxygenase-like cupin family protein
MIKRMSLCVATFLFVLVSLGGQAQQDQIKRTMLQKVEFPAQYVTLVGTAELPPGGALGRHTHPGIETGYILEGDVIMSVEGQPDRQLKAGDSYQVAPGVPHSLKNASKDKPLKGLATWVVERDKPLSSPAPK